MARVTIQRPPPRRAEAFTSLRGGSGSKSKRTPSGVEEQWLINVIIIYTRVEKAKEYL
jgi:hypothetical protein